MSERARLQQVAADLRAQGFRPYARGDAARTGMSARWALLRQAGIHLQSDPRDPMLWEVVPGPMGGAWIRYNRQAKRGKKHEIE